MFDKSTGLDGSYHPESGGTLMGAAASVAKNVASHITEAAIAPTADTSVASADNSPLADDLPEGENGTRLPRDAPVTNGRGAPGAEESLVHAGNHGHGPSGGVNGSAEDERRGKPIQKSEGSVRRSTMTLNLGPGGNLLADRRVSLAGGATAASDRRAAGGAGVSSSKGTSPSRATDGVSALPTAQGSPDITFAEKQRRKKSSESAVSFLPLLLVCSVLRRWTLTTFHGVCSLLFRSLFALM